MPFIDYYSDLMGFVPKLSVELAKKLVNRARADIYGSRLWSFLIVESQLTAPALVNAGSATFTQYSTTVIGDAVASAAWTGLFQPVITLRQIRAGGGPIYSITAADFTDPAAVVLTIDRPYQESTALTQYSIYRCYYTPLDANQAPTADFLKWVSIFDPINGYALKLNYTQSWLNRVDPLRGDVGQPYRVVSYKTINDTNGDPIHYYELWPHPTFQIGYRAFYQRGGLDFRLTSDALPSELPTELLEVRARYRAYEWAEANKGTHPELQKTNWMAMRQALMNPRDQASYPALLAQAKKEDEERFQVNFVEKSYPDFRFPIDSDFLQAHSWSWEYPGEIEP